MKKIFTLLLAMFAFYGFSQNGSGNLHVFNDNTNHSLDLYFTLFTIVPSTCSSSIQGEPYAPPLVAGGIADYTTFAQPHHLATPTPVYPFDLWWTGGTSPVLASSIPAFVQAASRWHYMKFELKDPTNPGTIPSLGGSVGFYPACGGIPASINGSGTLNGTNYSFSANAFTFGGDLWIHVQ